LFNDPTILSRHATIRQESGRYVLQAEPGAAVLINKQPINRQALSPENEVMIGGTRLIYRSRKAMIKPSADPVEQPPSVQSPPPQQPPMQPRPQQMRHCKACNTPNRVEAKFCANCGRSIV
jgi:pSer/pThr/pTyr-binding forkhead associated (FHA) protein